jgi:hypothetical protein
VREVRAFYRIVRKNPPTADDFTSNAAKGRPLRDPSPETRRLWDGLSVNATEAQARRRARQYPVLGAYIAVLEIPVASSVRVERTTGVPGHHTMWGEPEELLRFVVRVVAV